MNETPLSNDDERSILFSALVDEVLTAEQEQRLVELLRADALFRQDYVRMCQFSTHLLWISSAPMQFPSNRSKLPAPDGLRQRWPSLGIVSVSMVLLLVVLGIAWMKPLLVRNRRPALLTDIRGTVTVQRGNQPPVAVRNGDAGNVPWPLRVGDRIQTDADGSAVVTLADQTRMFLGSRTELHLFTKPDVRVVVSRGQITAHVSPQKSHIPMVFVTPRVSVRVLGTELDLRVVEERTEVAVTEGKVRVTRPSDGAAIEVAAGQMLPVDETGPLVIAAVPSLPDEWQEDFEHGLPPGWTGQLVREGLPAGSHGALQGTMTPDPSGLQLVAGSPFAEQGLFAWHPDTMLRVTFRVQPPAWFHICFDTRSNQDTSPVVAWCHIDPTLWRTQPGEWRTVLIPLSAFHWTGSSHPETGLGRIPLRLSFVGPVDLPGVVIDSLHIERNGSHAPGRNPFKPEENRP